VKVLALLIVPIVIVIARHALHHSHTSTDFDALISD
jgi:hypothetical protein